MNVDVFWACVRRGLLVSAVGVTRPEELAAIDDFIATHGVRYYEPRYAVTTDAFVPLHVATARIAAIDTRSDPFGYARLLHRLAMAWSR